MAMTKCKECGKEVSTKADRCPHCGVKNPGNKGSVLGAILLILVIIGIVGALISSNDSGGSSDGSTADNKNAEKTSEQKAAEEAACKKDLQCWGGRHSIKASFLCDDKIEAMAKYHSKWTDGLLEPKFSHLKWKNSESLFVTYIGDKIVFQNGFGAWENHIYECDIDTVAGTVLNVRARSGRLN